MTFRNACIQYISNTQENRQHLHQIAWAEPNIHIQKSEIKPAHFKKQNKMKQKKDTSGSKYEILKLPEENLGNIICIRDKHRK